MHLWRSESFDCGITPSVDDFIRSDTPHERCEDDSRMGHSDVNSFDVRKVSDARPSPMRKWAKGGLNGLQLYRAVYNESIPKRGKRALGQRS
jgi:hypothetical protein